MYIHTHIYVYKHVSFQHTYVEIYINIYVEKIYFIKALVDFEQTIFYALPTDYFIPLSVKFKMSSIFISYIMF